jgi:hypothetical protein
VEEIRRRLGAQQYGEQRANLAREWLTHQESLKAERDRAEALSAARAANALAEDANRIALASKEAADEANASAREANSLARSANTTADDAAASARRSADAARINNTIATLALIAAVIAIAMSIFGMFIKH